VYLRPPIKNSVSVLYSTHQLIYIPAFFVNPERGQYLLEQGHVCVLNATVVSTEVDVYTREPD
jgi:hypothetical protein